MLLGILGARYRDIPPIINSVIQVLFLASPIAWDAAKLGAHSKIVLLNPVTYALDLVRSPLLGHAPMGLSWLAGIGFFIVGLPSALAIGVIAGICRIVPYMDVVVGGSLSIISCLYNFTTWYVV